MDLNVDFLSVNLEPVEEGDGLLGILSSSEINKRIPFRFLGNVVAGNLNRVYGAIALEVLSDIRLVYVVHLLIVNKPLNADLTVLLFATGNLFKTVLLSLVLLILLLLEFSCLCSPIFLGLRSLNHQSLTSELLT